jgi:stage II sporulation protein D
MILPAVLDPQLPRRSLAVLAVFLVVASCATGGGSVVRAPAPAPAPDRALEHEPPSRVVPTEPQPALVARGDAPANQAAPLLGSPAPPVDPTAGADAGSTFALPSLIRVGLESDLDAFQLVPTSDGSVLRWEATELPLDSGAVVRPAAAAAGRGFYRLQAGALRDPELARRLAADLAQRTGQPGDVAFDAALGLFKVRVGSYADREGAQAAQDDLRELGIEEPWIVHEDRGLAEAGLEVELQDRVAAVPGRWLALETPSQQVEYGKQRYRGRLLVYLNDRGRLNVINELTFEDYLRGVVPMELGPELYPELEALKAQAVAARTYTVRNLGEFEREGFDICGSARCQVYGGMSAERPLSDQAIEDTWGQVLLYRDRPVDALYSAMCGGHTEDVGVVFPRRQEPYLRGVPCLEGGLAALPTTVPLLPLSEHLATILAGAKSATGEPGELLRALAARIGAAEPRAQAPANRRDHVARYLSSTFDLYLPAPLLVRLGAGAPSRAALSAADTRLLEALEGALQPYDDRPLEAGAQMRLVVELARYLGLYEQRSVRFLELAGEREVRVAEADGPAAWTLDLDTAGYRLDDSGLLPAPLTVAAGDPLDLHLVAGRLAALVAHSRDVPVTRLNRSRSAQWTRHRSTAQLRDLVARQIPGFLLSRLAVLEEGRSGRVAALELIAVDGRREVVEGLAVRWLLDLPDTWFTFEREARGETPGWVFHGSGWGHGVGLCQTGAFGMALRGHDYSQILHHYYSGVELVRAPEIAQRAAVVARERGRPEATR